MNTEQQKVIQNGINVTLTDGTIEHFTLTSQDQTSLMGLQSQVAQRLDNIPWHTSDQTEHCKYYSNANRTLYLITVSYFFTILKYFNELILILSVDLIANISCKTLKASFYLFL